MGQTITVPFVSLQAQHRELAKELETAYRTAVARSQFIQGPACDAFERQFADYLAADHAVGCGNGLDALQLILMALGIQPGDEVIVPAHTYIATALAVSRTGARPVLCDVEPDFFALNPERLEAAITPRTRAIVAVHLYGQVGRWDELAAIAQRHGIALLEDAAQAHGAVYRGRKAGTLGFAAGFSFYPTKNLGALGDGGCVTTMDTALADRVRLLGNYGSQVKYRHEVQGINSRLDELQAAFLACKLPCLNRWNRERGRIAQRYLEGIHNSAVRLPKENPDGTHVWHVFAVTTPHRDALAQHLQEQGIGTLIHYPNPIHLHEAYRDLGCQVGDYPTAEAVCRTQLSLPVFYGMTDEQIHGVIQAVNRFTP